MYSLAIILLLCVSFFPMVLSASSCTDLDTNLFGQCTAIGINHTSAAGSNETADVLSGIITKFKRCSPDLVNLMACSVNVPKCRGESDGRPTVLPCRKVCDTFVSQCAGQNGVEFFRKLCPLLSLNDTCLKPPDFKSNSTGSSQSCSLLSVSQCTGLGYNETSQPSSVQQVLQESEIMAGIENASTAVRRLVCAELVPPCFSGKRDKLVVGCKDSCLSASRNHSKKFLEVFKTAAYCDGLPDHRLANGGGEFCFRSTWPQSGFWSEGLRWAFRLQEASSTSPPTTNAPTTTPLKPNDTTTESTAVPSISTTETPTGASANVSTTKAGVNVTTGAPPVTDANSSSSVPTTILKNSTTTPASSPPTDASDNVTAVYPNANSSTNEPTTMQSNYTTTLASLPPTDASANVTTVSPNANSSTNEPTQPGNSTTVPRTTPSAGASTAETTMAPTTKPPINTTTEPSNETATTTPTANVATTNSSSSTKKPKTTTPPATEGTITAKTSSESPPVGSVTMSTATKPAATESPTKTGKGDTQARKDTLTKSGLSAGAIAGVAIGTICGVVLLIALAIFIIRRRRIAMQYTHRVMVDMDDL